eukprot:scaffold1800_cov237-Pinguiococcus_pyrenoidosus.AAC.4
MALLDVPITAYKTLEGKPPSSVPSITAPRRETVAAAQASPAPARRWSAPHSLPVDRSSLCASAAVAPSSSAAGRDESFDLSALATTTSDHFCLRSWDLHPLSLDIAPSQQASTAAKAWVSMISGSPATIPNRAPVRMAPT